MPRFEYEKYIQGNRGTPKVTKDSAVSVDMTLDTKAFQKAIEELPHAIIRKHVRKAIKAAAQEVLEDAQNKLVPLSGYESGELKRSGKETTSAPTKKNAAKPFVKSKVEFKVAHAHLIELGHRIVSASGKDTGKRAKAFGFLRKSTDENREKAIRSFIKAIEAAYKESGRKYGNA